MRILVMGGTGFIGRRVAVRLARAGHRVRVPTRRLAHGRELLVLPTVTVLERDVHDDAVLDALLRDCDAAVNLVGILHGGRGRLMAGASRVRMSNCRGAWPRPACARGCGGWSM